MTRLNKDGFRQILESLNRHHRLGAEHFTESMLNEWAQEAEANHENGQGCHFEIRRWDSISGQPVEVYITHDGYEVESENE